MSTFDDFKGIYENNARTEVNDINLFHTIHLSENDHTNILWDILRYTQDDKHIFYDSFLENVLCIEAKKAPMVGNVFKKDCQNNKNCQEYEIIRSGTQYKAIGLDKKGKDKENNGYIDLVLNDYDNGSVVIIENKVCDASDGEKQLERYYYSFVKYTDDNKEHIKDFEDNHNKHWETLGDNTYNNVYLVYLTKDGSKEPSTGSISNDLKEQLVKSDNYIPVSYGDSDNSKGKSILAWLKEDVLPNITYNENGYLIDSVKLYIEYIETVLLGQGCDYSIYNSIWEKYSFAECYKQARLSKSKIETEINDKTEIDETIFNEYQNCALYFAEQKIRELLPGGWNVHCAGTFFMIYKEEWRQCEKRKYTIPTFCVAVNDSEIKNYINSNNKELKLKWQFQIEHISIDKNNAQCLNEKDGVHEILKMQANVGQTNHKKTNVYTNEDWNCELTSKGLKDLCKIFEDALNDEIMKLSR